MKYKRGRGFWLAIAAMLLAAGCSNAKSDTVAEAPPPANVEKEPDLNVVEVDHPEQFPLVAATPRLAAAQLVVTGTVTPDVSRTVPVVSLASGRVVEINAQLGDDVKKGQLLMRTRSSDVSAAFSDYRKAIADETLAKTQLERAKLLYDKGAISQNEYQVAQDAENKAKVDAENSLDNSPNLFTIADLSSVWILCDVYENDLATVHLGETADIRLNAYPGKVLTGRISNISPILDPTMRAAKVRIQV